MLGERTWAFGGGALAARRWVMAVASLGSMACGYRSLATGSPNGQGSLFVAPFEESSPSDLSPPLTRRLRLRAAAAGAAAASRGAARSTLSGRVRVGERMLADTARRRALAPKLTFEAELTGADGRRLWQHQLTLDRLTPQAIDGPGGWTAAEAQRQTLLEQMAIDGADIIWEALETAEWDELRVAAP